MHKFVLTALSVIMAASLASCGKNTDMTDANKKAETENIVQGEISGEITVSCYDTMIYEKFLNEAAELFQQEHPGTKINIEAQSKMPEIKTQQMEDGSVVSVTDTGDDSQDVANYINRINTELMSGRGPDILAIDVLPYYKYAESGTLDNLSAYIESDKDFNINNYMSNIIEGTKYKGGQYIVPLDFGFQFISFDKSRVNEASALKLREKNKFTYWELSDLVSEQFANDSSGARVIDFQNGVSQALRSLINSNYKKYIDLENKKANFTDGDFVKLLNNVKEQRDKGWFKPDFQSVEEMTNDFVENQDLYYYKYQIDMVLKYIFYPRDDMPEQSAFPFPDADEIAGILANDAGEVPFRCFQLYGMNTYSQNKKLAWEFIKFMLGEEMQQSLNLLGYPVNNTAFIEDSKMNLIKMPNYVPVVEGDYEGEYTVDGFQMLTDEKYLTAYDEFMKYLNVFVNDLNFYPVTDEIIGEMISSETAQFFNGTKTADEVADTLQNKVQMYLDE